MAVEEVKIVGIPIEQLIAKIARDQGRDLLRFITADDVVDEAGKRIDSRKKFGLYSKNSAIEIVGETLYWRRGELSAQGRARAIALLESVLYRQDEEIAWLAFEHLRDFGEADTKAIVRRAQRHARFKPIVLKVGM